MNKDTPINLGNPNNLEDTSQELGIKANQILYYNPSLSSIRLQVLWGRWDDLLICAYFTACSLALSQATID